SRLVQYALVLLDDLADRVVVPDVHVMDRDPPAEVLREVAHVSRGEVVEDAHVVALGHQTVDEVASDEARASRDQYLCAVQMGTHRSGCQDAHRAAVLARTRPWVALNQSRNSATPVSKSTCGDHLRMVRA